MRQGSRAHSALKNPQAGGRCDAGLSPLGAMARESPMGKFRILRAALWAWKLAEPSNSRARSSSLGKHRAGRAFISDKQLRSTWRIIWGTRLAAFTPPQWEDYGRRRC
jgi:hypothetical protein